MHPTESQEQQRLAVWLNEIFGTEYGGTVFSWWHTPNGGKREAHRNRWFKRLGVKSGIPDIILLRPFVRNETRYVGVALELKARQKEGKAAPILSKSQRIWLAIFSLCGFYTAKCHGEDDAKYLLTRLYGLDKPDPPEPVYRPRAICWRCMAPVPRARGKKRRKCQTAPGLCTGEIFEFSSIAGYIEEIARKSARYTRKKRGKDGPVDAVRGADPGDHGGALERAQEPDQREGGVQGPERDERPAGLARFLRYADRTRRGRTGPGEGAGEGGRGGEGDLGPGSPPGPDQEPGGGDGEAQGGKSGPEAPHTAK